MLLKTQSIVHAQNLTSAPRSYVVISIRRSSIFGSSLVVSLDAFALRARKKDPIALTAEVS